MHREDISKIHVADLRGKFQFAGGLLDIVEMRAVRHCLPNWGRGNPKADWLDDFDRKLNELARAETNGTTTIAVGTEEVECILVTMTSLSCCIYRHYRRGTEEE